MSTLSAHVGGTAGDDASAFRRFGTACHFADPSIAAPSIDADNTVGRTVMTDAEGTSGW
jgi:hypothetical protein